ncbi:biotin--[acetyl-CoA-carboxylase] ligase [bacterium]|nr:biotin--[acetyl-CoA-carboxylase] ligase [bacterium]
MDNVLNKEMIEEALKTDIFGGEIYAFNTIDSTNRFAKKLAKAGKPEGTLIYSEEQTHGQGRWGRSWDSPRGKGLWFSLILRPQKHASVPLLSLLGAVSLAQIVRQKFNFSPQIKQPNDLLFNGLKLAGILVETSIGQNSVAYAVIGIGLNVNQERSDFAPPLKDKAISLRMAVNHVVDRLDLLADLLAQLENNYRLFTSQDFDFIFRESGLSGTNHIQDLSEVYHAVGG